MNYITTADLLLISPIVCLILFSLIPLTTKVLNKNVEQKHFISLMTALIGMFISAVLLVLFGNSEQTIFNNQLLFDGLTKWGGILCIVSGAAALILALESPSTNKRQYSELIFLLMNCVAGMLLLISSNNLIIAFIGLELMSLPLYLMTAFSEEQKFSKEAAIKYFVLGSFASAVFLYGVSFVFGTANTITITDLMQIASTGVQANKLFLFGILFIVIGFCFKVSIAPFHMWTPDVYHGAPTPITSFMATAVKAATFAAFLRIASTQVFLGSHNLLEVMQWLAVITMTVGNVAALVQTNFKRFLAYSSIANSGYILIGVITVGISPNSANSASGVLFYLVGYIVASIGAFAVLNLIEKNENDLVETERLSGFSKSQPLLSFCLALFLLSMAGIPPLIGFFGKFYVFSAAVDEGLLWVTIWAVINSAIGVYYYLRPIVMMYMKDGDVDVARENSYGSTVLVLACAVFIVLVGIFSGPLFNLIENNLG